MSPKTTSPTLEPNSIFANDFQIVRQLGAGGMGSVYVVNQISTGKPRALKLMLPQLVADASLRRRFEQEARVGSLIESDHVVEVVGAGVDEATGTPWLAMELLKGEDLGAFAARGPVPLATVQLILRQLCHAVGAAHAANIVHRDLKPENIYLGESKRAGETRVVKVLDFGIAKIAAEASTKHTGAIGSPIWMAPEQTERGVVTPAADVWPIALIAFRLLTGKNFWLGAEDDEASLHQVMREVLFEPIPLASARAVHYGAVHALPPWFDVWFGQCVVRDAAQRFANATSAFAAFDRECGQLAPPPSSLGPSGPFTPTPPSPSPQFYSNPPQPSQPSQPPSHHSNPPPPRGNTVVQDTNGALSTGSPAWQQNEQGSSHRGARIAAGVLLGVIVITGLGFGVSRWRSQRVAITTATTSPSTSPSASDSSAFDESSDDQSHVNPVPTLSVASAHHAAGSHSATGPALSTVLAQQAASGSNDHHAEGTFDRNAAIIAVSGVDVQSCAQPDGPRGVSRVFITFAEDGNATRVIFEKNSRYIQTPTGQCIGRRYHAVHVSPFSGNPQSVQQVFQIR